MMIQAETSSLRARYGPWAVVTGASAGIGRAFATELAMAGVHLVLVARTRAALEELARELTAHHGIETLVIAADLGDDTATRMLADVTAHLDVGLLVAAAGYGGSGRLIDIPLEEQLDMLDVNCRHVLALSHTFGTRFAARGRGGLVLMSSLLAFQGVARAATYAATKAFVQTLAEGLHAELGPRGVHVVASAPGPIRSGFAARARMHMGVTGTPDVVARATLRALGRRATVRPGWLAKVLALSLALLPRWGRVRVMGVVMSGMTRADAVPA